MISRLQPLRFLCGHYYSISHTVIVRQEDSQTHTYSNCLQVSIQPFPDVQSLCGGFQVFFSFSYWRQEYHCIAQAGLAFLTEMILQLRLRP